MKKPHIRTITRRSVSSGDAILAPAHGSSRENSNALNRHGKIRAFVNVAFSVAKISYEEQPLGFGGRGMEDGTKRRYRHPAG